jgi:hypothetical protein
MMTFAIAAILIALGAIVYMQFFKKSPKPPAPIAPVEDLANLKVTDARPGDMLSIAGAGDDVSDLDFPTDRGTRFEAGARHWYELSGKYRERRVAVRIGLSDEVEVHVAADPRRVTLEDLGLAEEDLAAMDERQNTADSFEFDGAVWLYHLSREVTARREDQPLPVGFYYWEFREHEGRRLLSVRKAEGEPFAVTIYRGVEPGDVTVYRGR